MQIQSTYINKKIVAGIYNSSGELMAVSSEVTVTTDSITFIEIKL